MVSVVSPVVTHPLGDLDALVRPAPAPSVTLTVRARRPMAQVLARKGGDMDAALAMRTAPSRAHAGDGFVALPLAPGQWMLVGEPDVTPEDFAASIEGKVGEAAHVSQQSDARTSFRVSGPQARALMARGCRLDLDRPNPGFCAQTPMAQVGVLLHEVEAADGRAFDLYVYNGFARSFWHWLTQTAEQFDPEVTVER